MAYLWVSIHQLSNEGLLKSRDLLSFWVSANLGNGDQLVHHWGSVAIEEPWLKFLWAKVCNWWSDRGVVLPLAMAAVILLVAKDRLGSELVAGFLDGCL